MVIEPESAPFRYYSFSDRYSQNDTINIGSSYFTINNVSLNPPKISLEKLKGNYFYGFRKGYLSKNYEIEDLVGKKTDFKNVLGEKKLLLLDFWGTWCKPCKDLTPDLVHLYKEYGENISFLSIAYDQNAMQVKDYVDKNQMSWAQAFIKNDGQLVLKPPLLKNLRIKCYPTFILLDENLKIVFRECGNANFEKLKDFLENYKN